MHVQGRFIGLEGDAIRRAASEYKQREDDMKAAAESGQYLAVRPWRPLSYLPAGSCRVV